MTLDDEVAELMSSAYKAKRPDTKPEKPRQQNTFTCIGVRKGCIATGRGKAPVAIMELESDGMTALKFFNLRITKSKVLAVSRNSDFAKLYRLSVGINPTNRFSRVTTLFKHLVGIEFQCTTVHDTDKKGAEFYKVTSIKPLVPHVHDSWTATGSELKRPPKQKQQAPQNAVQNQQNFCNDSSIFLQNFDNAKSPQAKPDMGYRHFESHLTRNIGTYNIPPVPSPNPSLKTEPQRRIWEKRPDETEDDFLDRFLDDTVLRRPHQPFASSQTLH